MYTDGSKRHICSPLLSFLPLPLLPPSNNNYSRHQKQKLYITLGNDIILSLGDLRLVSSLLENNNDIAVGTSGLGALLGDG